MKLGQLLVCKNLTRLLRGIADCMRPVDEAGNVLEGIEDQHSAHECDAVRYVIGYLGRTSPGFLFKVY